MLKFLAPAAAALLLFAGSAAADEAPLPPPAAVTAKPSAEQLAAARDLLVATHVKELLGTVVNTLIPPMVAAVRRQNPNVSDDAINALTAALQDEMSADSDQLMDLYATIYAEHFTTDELQQLAAFYRSPVGQKYVATVPSMFKEIMPVAQAWGLEIGERVKKRLGAELQKRGETL
jgi:hypothetical protein